MPPVDDLREDVRKRIASLCFARALSVDRGARIFEQADGQLTDITKDDPLAAIAKRSKIEKVKPLRT